MNETELLMEYAACWNNLDVSYLKSILHDDFEYASQWVFDVMHGKQNYMDYLRGKFETIKRDVYAIPSAELGYFEFAYGEKNKPCLVITQKLEDGQINRAALIVKVKDGKICRADMVGVPHPDGAILLGMAPK